LINNGKSVVLEIETKGMSQILSKYSKEFKIVTIFFLPPSLETLKSRLVNRQTNTTADIENRLKRANDEIKASSNYNYKIVIDNTESAYSKLHDIVEKETTKYE
jgi:guanylate kinase